MKRKRIARWVLAMTGVLSLCCGQAIASVASVQPITAATHRMMTGLMGMPMQFEINYGQLDESVKFIARGRGYTLFLNPAEAVLVLRRARTKDERSDIAQSVVRMRLEGGNASPEIDGTERLPGIVNYFIGNDPARWRTEIPTFAKVRYREAYPGIDLAFYGREGRLEYDFIVAPGADPNRIKLGFEGMTEIRLAEGSGDLLLTTAVGEVHLQKPVVYQLDPDGHKTLVAGRYVVETSALSSQPSLLTLTEVRIQVAAYDTAKPLVIDPVIVYSTYLGGSGNDSGYGIAVDGSGQAHVVGSTASQDFPTLNPSHPGLLGNSDAFVTKFTASGTLAYSTYLGGRSGDRANGIAVDGTGQAYVVGSTSSADFPTRNPIQAHRGGGDAFVTKLTTAGALVYSTFLGGNLDDDGNGIAVDGNGQAYVVGNTTSTDFPTLGAIQTIHADNRATDAFVTKFTALGTLVYSTYLGGPLPEDGRGIAVDGMGQAYVTGSTGSPNFPRHNANQQLIGGLNDAFVTKFTALGALAYSTFLGGGNNDGGTGIAVDNSGQAYVTGSTASPNFPVLGAMQPGLRGIEDAFVTKFTASGALAYSTYLGGGNSDGATGIAVDGGGQAYAVGNTLSTDFPTRNASQAYGGGSDAFVTKFSATGTLAYSTYLGGGNTDGANGIAVDGIGEAYVVGSTRSVNFPDRNAIQVILGGLEDAFVTRLSEKPIANAGPNQTKNEHEVVALNGSGSSGPSLTYAWTQVAGPPVALTGANTVSPTFNAPMVNPAGATLTFQLVVTSNGIDSDPDTMNVHVRNVNQPPVSDAGQDQTVQEGSPVVLDGSGSFDPDVETLSYHWNQIVGPAVTLSGANTVMPSFVAPTVGQGGATLVFDLTVADPHTLTGSDSVSIHISNVNQSPTADAGSDQTVNENTGVTLNGTGSSDPDLDALHFIWNQTGGPSVVLTGATTANPTFTAPTVGVGGANLTFQLVVSDGQATSASDMVFVHVQDTNDPPVCTLAHPSVESLWPPNHTMVPVSIVGVTDPSNHTIAVTFPAVTQDEPVSGLGDGDTSPDAAVSGNQILLRAERSGSGNGRVYVVHFTATDDQGGSCSGTVKVGVPHSKKDTAIEGPQLHTSYGP